MKKNVYLMLVGFATSGISTNYAYASNCEQSLTADFATRDAMPQYNNSNHYDSWGPKPITYKSPLIPAHCDRNMWQQQRIIAVAEKYIGLPYRHHHVPGFDKGTGAGLDCSNFTAWVYNYGLGKRFSSEITMQSKTAGRQLDPSEPLQPGDLLFIRTIDDKRISHVVIYIDPKHIIDDHGAGVKVREFKGWYKNHFAYARRVIGS